MSLKEEYILLTGASGFVGGHVLDLARRQKLKVRALVRDKARAKALQALGVEVSLGDVTDRSSLVPALKGITSVIHIAAAFRRIGIPDSHYFEVNAHGTKNLLDLSVAAGVQKFVHCSTVGVLGHVSNPPADESMPYNPGDVYQASKMEGEQSALEYFSSGKIKGIVIRPAMVYGPGDRRTFKLFKMVRKGIFFYVGDGSTFVHFIDVRDLARAFFTALTHAEEFSGNVYIIAGERALPLREMAEIVAQEFGVNKPFLRLPVKPMQFLGSACERICRPLRIDPPLFRRRVDFFTKARHFTSAKAARDLGFYPTTDCRGEVRDIIKWYELHGYLPRRKGVRSDSSESNYSSDLVLMREQPIHDLGPTELNSGSQLIMVRNFEGDIHFWNEGAALHYGWQESEALGAISHDLLKTEFPAPLEHINEVLARRRMWIGELIHKHRAGRVLKVKSRWTLCDQPKEQARLVLEVNEPVSELS